MDKYAGSRKETQIRYFRRLPESAELKVVTRYIERSLAFDLRPRPIDKPDPLRKQNGQYYTYNGRTFKALPTPCLLDLAAIPADKTKPTLFINWGRIYVKYLNGAPLTHVTENYFNDDWKEVKFVEE